MLYYREKIILSLLEEFNYSLSKTQLQKYLFLFTRMQKEHSYNFVPYFYGCYSFQATKDLEHLQKENLVNDEGSWILNPVKKLYKDMLNDDDRMVLFKIRKHFKNLTSDNLIRHVYLEYPFYTINSTIKEKMLSKEEINNLDEIVSSEYNLDDETTTLFTIGYEGLSIEQYLNKLIQNNIKLLLDVRKNPFSHKYGFSKNLLENFTHKFGIKYIHIPSLGIVSDKRKELETLSDYQSLFNEYEETLKDKHSDLNNILKYINQYGRVALTCFEKDVEMCHRTRIKNYIINNLQTDLKVVEL